VEASRFLLILPEILVVVLALTVLSFEMVWKDDRRRNIGWMTAGGLVLIIVLALLFSLPDSSPELVWGGMLRHDWLAFVFKVIAMFAAAMTALFSMDVEDLGTKGEYYLLLLVSTLGMMLMAGSANLVMLFLAIETTSIPLYAMAGFYKEDNQSTEAGFKYLLFGALASAIMLYGFSLLFGFTGTTDIYSLARLMQVGGVDSPQVMTAALMVLVGFGFKISAVPFHFWAPDVYTGAPTPIAGFLSTASKAAGFAVLMRVMLEVFPFVQENWAGILAALAVVTMTLGNTVALAQKNIKRLLAYSSVAHAGYILLGVVALSVLGMSSAVFYLIAYLTTNLAAFGIVSTASRTLKSDEIAAYAGLSRRNPTLALAMLAAFLSLAGIPPLSGFVAKLWVFAAVVQSELYWLAFIGVINAIIGMYYYLTVLKVVYLHRSEKDDVPVPMSRPDGIALGVLCLLILLVGTIFGPWWGFADAAAAALF